MKRRIALIAVCCLLFAGCTKSGGGTASHSFGSPNELHVETWAIPKNLNPLYITNTSENFLASLAFDLLVTVDPKGNEVPDLAAVVPTLKNGGISRDGLTIVYRLRRNVTWQDGAPFTSADVKYSWQAVMNPNDNVVERRGYDVVRSVDTPNAFTVVFHLKTPFAPFVDTVFGESDDPFRIVPKHLLAKYANLNDVPFNSSPIGTGPFRVVRFIPGDEIVYAANPRYFRGKPHLSRIIVHFVTNDNTRETDLRSHVSDLANDVAPTVIRDVRGDREIVPVMVNDPQYLSLAMNGSQAPLDDLRVRRAIAYAVDKNAIVRDDTYGTAVPATADLSPYYWAYSTRVPQYRHDAAEAGRLLQQAGWIPGPGGVRMKNGKPLNLELAFQIGFPTYRVVSVEIQSELQRVGIGVQIKQYDPTLLYATEAAGGILTSGKFDLALYPWVAGADPDDSQQWMCRYVPPAGNDITHYCNAALDAAERDALTHFSRTVRKAAYATTQDLLARDVPSDFLYYPKRLYIVNPALKHFTPNGISEGWNAYQWSLQ